MVDRELQQAVNRITNSIVDANAKQSTFRGLLYGPSGTGKSTIAAMIMRSIVPEGQIILHIDTSEGYVSWRNHPGLSDGIKTLPFTTNEDLRVIALAIKEKVAPFNNVGGIILDESSKMTEQDVSRVYEARLDGAYGPVEQSRAKDQAGQEGRDYMIALERFRKMIFELFDNRQVHIILIAHQAEKKNKQGALMSIGPDFSPKVAKAAKELLHLSAHITATVVKNPNDLKNAHYERVAQVHPTTIIDAKCRLGIRTTSVNAEHLPMIIKEWANSGVTLTEDEIKADDDIRKDEIHDNLNDATIEGQQSTTDILTTIENSEPELDSSLLENLFTNSK